MTPFVIAAGLLAPLWYHIGPLLAAAELVNVTIDDYYRDEVGDFFVYSPTTSWTRGNENCTTCSPQLDPLRTKYATWHENIYNSSDTVFPGASVPFEGLYWIPVPNALHRFIDILTTPRRPRDIRLLCAIKCIQHHARV